MTWEVWRSEEASGVGFVHLELGRQWKVTFFNTFSIKRKVHIFNTKICMEATFENFARTVRGGQFQHLCVEIEFLHQILRSPHHLEPITRCHVALFDKI
jgi:hypothetical protein